MPNPASSRTLRLGATLAALILFAIVAFALRTVRLFRATSDSVLHSQEVRLQFGEMTSRLKDNQLSTRAFLMSGDARSLEARSQAQEEFAKLTETVRQLTSDNPRQQQSLDRLTQLVAQLGVEYDAYVEARRAGGLPAVIARSRDGEGKRLADEIRSVALEIEAEERRLLEERLARARGAGALTNAVLLGGLLLDAILVGTIVVTLRRDMKAREAAGQIVQQARVYSESIVDTVREPLVILTQDLRVNSANRGFHETFQLSAEEIAGRPFAELNGGVWNIPELQAALATVVPEHNEVRDFEVRRDFPGLGAKVMLLNARKLYRLGNNTTMTLLAIEDITERKKAEAQLEKANASLRQRSTELETANEELEAFSYSVSHDLRAPLRHIDYFSATLQKNLPPEQLDEKNTRHLKSISDSARRMGQLIDDLLALAQVSRSQMRRSRVPLAELVAQAQRDLQGEINGRAIVWEVAALPEVTGDARLLQQVFANLVGNAVKYTRQRPEARITIGTQPGAPGETIVFIRDNGAGFDMQYADKLFGVFQRLHSDREFEGTGVGLANVRRIIQRHGGRTWAEGAVGAGATFYFSLPTAGA